MASPRVKKILVAVLLLVAVIAGLVIYVVVNMPSHTKGVIEKTTASGDKLRDAIRRGLAFLKSRQEKDGNFVMGRFSPKPAFTALVIDAFINSPEKYKIDEHPFLIKATEALVAAQHKDGSIHSDIPVMSFSNYTTALAVVALKETGDPRFAPIIAKARTHLKGTIHESTGANDVTAGGFGYQPGSRPDLNNTTTVLEALDGIPKDDPIYAQVRKFISNTQNRSESNKQKWAANNDGGFIYRPGESPAGTFKDRATNETRYASYGVMTSAGLISLLYAHVEKTDPRVKAAFDWLAKNYSVVFHAGMPKDKADVGLYYYYRVLSKALYLYSEPFIVTPDGVKHEWAKDLSRQLLSLQKKDGSWVNKNKTYLEDDAVLVTAYATRALGICYTQIHQTEQKKSASAREKK